MALQYVLLYSPHLDSQFTVSVLITSTYVDLAVPSFYILSRRSVNAHLCIYCSF